MGKRTDFNQVDFYERLMFFQFYHYDYKLTTKEVLRWKQCNRSQTIV